VREIASGDRSFDFGDASRAELKGLDGFHEIYDFFWQEA